MHVCMCMHAYVAEAMGVSGLKLRCASILLLCIERVFGCRDPCMSSVCYVCQLEWRHAIQERG